MPELKLKQLQYESDSWKRLLGFIMDENIHLKNRLSEVLKDKFDNNLLEEVEGFQSSFIKEDELIGLLRNDVAELDKLLVREIFEDGKIANEIDKKLNRLRNNITIAEKQFGKLKVEFNSYLSENV
jgi:regulator of replication initiation timing